MGGAMSGDATDLFAALQFNTSLGGSGYIGRYNRSTGTRDLTWSASTDTTERLADVITGIADAGTLVYVSDHPDNLVRCYTTAGVWQSDWSLTDPGAIALDGSGNIWVAQKNEGTIQEFSPSGSMLKTINMGSSSRPSALYFDSANNQLMVGDQGPNMNIQIVIPALKPLRGSFEMKYCGCLFMRIVSLVSEVTFSSHFWVTCPARSAMAATYL
jgi:SMP-30/Gluconolactonase/LRE-like region